MKAYYDKLMEFNGAEPLKALVSRWEVLSENLSKRSFDAPILLPDLFLYTSPGYGNTALLTLLADYLDSRKNLMTFYGDVKFFEFKLGYCRPDEVFTELYRLMEAARNAAGFRNEFRGLIRINIDEWIGHHKEKYFMEFLQFLESKTSHWLIALSLSCSRRTEETTAMEAVVSMYLRLETLIFPQRTKEDLLGFAELHLAKYDLTLDDGARAVLEESIEVLRGNKYFYGLHTIQDFCNDIVYVIYSGSTDVSHVITAEMIAGFGPEGDYIRRTITKVKKSVALGF